jgi:hypothetical protein
MIGLMIHSTVTDPLSVYYEPVATVARGYTEQIHTNLYSLPKFTGRFYFSGSSS